MKKLFEKIRIMMKYTKDLDISIKISGIVLVLVIILAIAEGISILSDNYSIREAYVDDNKNNKVNSTKTNVNKPNNVQTSKNETVLTNPQPTEKKIPDKLPTLLVFDNENDEVWSRMHTDIKEIQQEYKYELNIKFIDIMKDNVQLKKYKISKFPMLILLDIQGNEIGRYEGTAPKGDIINKLKEVGVIK